MTDLPKLKEPTSFEEQVEILLKKGLLIPDEDKAIRILKTVNYYRLSAYTLTLKKDDTFFAGTSIDNIYALYEFDRKLRNLLMGLLESIEIAFRTHVAYFLAHQYGATGYLNPDNFKDKDYHADFIKTFNIELSRADELFVRHHHEKYGGQFPIWVAVEVLSFSTLSKLFSNLKNVDKQYISKEYYGAPHFYITSWLRVLTVVRNICAHYGRLYDKKIKVAPRLDTADSKLGIGVDKIFASIFVMKKLYPNKTAWNDFVINLQALIEQYNDVDCKLIGFCDDWETILKA